MRSSAIVLIVTAFSGFAKAFPNWGCMAPDFLTSKYLDLSKYPSHGMGPLENVVTGPNHPANSFMGCPTHCRALQRLSDYDNYPEMTGDIEKDMEAMEAYQKNFELYNSIRMSVFRPGTGGELGECYCLDHSALEKSADAMVQGNGPNGDCTPEDFQLMDLQISRPTTVDVYYELESCVAENPFSWSIDPGYPPESETEPGVPPKSPGGVFEMDYVEMCLVQCGWGLHDIYLLPRPGFQAWMCYCGPGKGDLAPTTCGPGVGRVYRIGNAPVPSDFARKRALAARGNIQAELATYKHCPRGLDACSVTGSASAYECLDTKTELEACGGCVDGYFDRRVINGTTGTDCTGLSGVALGGSTCVNGHCKVTKCRKGYRLDGGRCVTTFSFV